MGIFSRKFSLKDMEIMAEKLADIASNNYKKYEKIISIQEDTIQKLETKLNTKPKQVIKYVKEKR